MYKNMTINICILYKYIQKNIKLNQICCNNNYNIRLLFTHILQRHLRCSVTSHVVSRGHVMLSGASLSLS